ncbi:DsbA family protein [Dickeya oryzae]|uniref:DsbA family oxidoreductase n=1 Tax=Dickeya oryzae TaxID=1240404 RepID=UPI0020969210|nr:DsbA family protein [Dickeya oryzae]MCO7254447.1 DsbA family protein [Dickeya oryzae]
MLKIDLYTEITCPWCIIGQYRLDKVLKERFPELAVDIHHHPILLMPDAPAQGLYIPDLLFKRYGVTNPKTLFARVEDEARASGLDLDLERQRYTYPTQAAHAIIMAAGDRGTQHQLAVAITEAYFLHAKNIGKADVLADIAISHGFERDEALAIAHDQTWHERVAQAATDSAAAGVQSVPYFVFGTHVAINGGRSEDEITAAIVNCAP